MNRREQEILTALFKNPKGLTTAQTTAWCISQVGAELPNNSSIVSKLIFDLRRKGYLTSFDSSTGKSHKITDFGKALLAEELAEELEIDKAEIPKLEDEVVMPKLDADDVNYADDDLHIDYLHIDKEGEYAAIARLITEHAALKALCTIDKMTEKLEILNQLISSPFIDETVTSYLQEIADDLKGVRV